MRFQHKWNEIQAGRMTTVQAGKWWVDKFGDISEPNKLASGKTSMVGKTKRQLKNEYVQTKLNRHGITYFK